MSSAVAADTCVALDLVDNCSDEDFAQLWVLRIRRTIVVAMIEF